MRAKSSKESAWLAQDGVLAEADSFPWEGEGEEETVRYRLDRKWHLQPKLPALVHGTNAVLTRRDRVNRKLFPSNRHADREAAGLPGMHPSQKLKPTQSSDNIKKSYQFS